MNRDPMEHREEILSEQFDRGSALAQSPEEQPILDDYRDIRETLRTYPLWEIDSAALVKRMAQEAHPKAYSSPSRVWKSHAWLAAASVACVILTTAGLGFILRIPAAPPVTQIVLENTATQANQSPSWLWQRRLQQGRLVTVPENAQARFSLRDGSTLECRPGTQIAIDYEQGRNIRLQTGYLHIHAASIPEATLTVQTPLNQVEVIGTEFWVEVVQP